MAISQRRRRRMEKEEMTVELWRIQDDGPRPGRRRRQRQLGAAGHAALLASGRTRSGFHSRAPRVFRHPQQRGTAPGKQWRRKPNHEMKTVVFSVCCQRNQGNGAEDGALAAGGEGAPAERVGPTAEPRRSAQLALPAAGPAPRLDSHSQFRFKEIDRSFP